MLLSEINDLENVVVRLNVSYPNSNLFPYEGIKGERQKLQWWKAFTDIKHSDSSCANEGCLSNVIYSFSALTILYSCLIEIQPYSWEHHTEDIISRINSVVDADKEKYLRFPGAKFPQS
jgi:hypothetical protein